MTVAKDPFGITITNTQTGQPSVYTGVAATLAIGVTNNTGAAIALTSGSSAFSVYLQPKGQNFFDVDKLKNITLNPCPWTQKWDDALSAITITCQQAGTWADGQTLTFTLANVIASKSSEKPSTVMLLPSGLGDDAPSFVQAYLAVMDPPKPGNLQLPEVLEVTLENQGTVYRSLSGDDPLGNILYLTLKNTGTTSLATGSQSGKPQVTVWFVYGSTNGALAPADYDTKTGAPVGAAWGITSGIVSAPKDMPWGRVDPHFDPQEKRPPQWTLAPSKTNNPLLGPAGSDQANVTFSFSNVVSVTPRGHTQMFVHCTGFKQDEQTAYDDHLFVLDIDKVDPPLDRGVLFFFGPQPVIPILDPNAPVTIPLQWTMFEVDRVHLISEPPVVTPAGEWDGPDKKYGSPPPMPLDHDGATVTLQRPGTSDSVRFTLQAFDGKDGLLNSQQFTVGLQAYVPRITSGTVYPSPIDRGQNTQLQWSSENADQDNGVHLILPDGTEKLYPANPDPGKGYWFTPQPGNYFLKAYRNNVPSDPYPLPINYRAVYVESCSVIMMQNSGNLEVGFMLKVHNAKNVWVRITALPNDPGYRLPAPKTRQPNDDDLADHTSSPGQAFSPDWSKTITLNNLTIADDRILNDQGDNLQTAFRVNFNLYAEDYTEGADLTTQAYHTFWGGKTMSYSNALGG